MRINIAILPDILIKILYVGNFDLLQVVGIDSETQLQQDTQGSLKNPNLARASSLSNPLQHVWLPTKGFCQVKNPRKTRKWVGVSCPNTDYYYFFVFMSGLDLTDPSFSRIFGFFFNLTRPLNNIWHVFS